MVLQPKNRRRAVKRWRNTGSQGDRISLVRLDKDGNPSGYETFAEGWLQRTQAWGRPVDLLVLEDGSLLLSDDKNGVIYRITYTSA